MNDREAFDNRRALVEQGAEIERLRTALGFYAKRENWIGTMQGDKVIVISRAEGDHGSRARTVLSDSGQAPEAES